MTSQQKNKVILTYGSSSQFEYDLDEDLNYSIFLGSPSEEDAEEKISSAIAMPLDFPPLDKAILSEDQIVIALEPGIPCAEEIVSQIWTILKSREVSPGQLTIIQPTGNIQPKDPRKLLPVEVRSLINWKIHDSTDEDACCYLATTMSGERIELAGAVVDADFVITVGLISYDPVLGCQGTSSILFPGLSNKEAYQKTSGQGHDELRPDNVRPVRQFIDEVGWLLGTQYTIQLIPGNNNGFSHVLTGLVESVQKQGEKLLAENWQLGVEERPETVVATIDLSSEDCYWDHLASAISSARKIVARDGRIIILSEMDCEPGKAMEFLHSTDQPEEITTLLKQAGTSDAKAALEIVNSTDWAKIYLLSKMDCDLVEDLFMIPLDNASQVKRLLSDTESVVFIQSAQNVYASVNS